MSTLKEMTYIVFIHKQYQGCVFKNDVHCILFTSDAKVVHKIMKYIVFNL